MRAKRLVLFIASLSGGGAERVLSQIANAWADQGIEVHLVTWNGLRTPDFYKVSDAVHRHELGQVNRPRSTLQRIGHGVQLLLSMRRLIRELAPDGVLSFIDVTNVLVLIASLGLPARIVVAERVDPATNNTLSLWWRLMRPMAYRQASLVVAQTREIAVWMESHWRASITVIPNFLRSMPPPAVNREMLVISVGRLVPQKAFENSIKAFARLSERHPEWRYVILGDGPMKMELLSLCDQLGISEKVSLPGLIEDVEAWLSRAAICVQPSRFEGFPNAVMEAMAMGVATISTDCRSGPKDLITPFENGLLVPVGDLSALEIAMERLIIDEPLRTTIGRSAVKVRERFSRDSVMRQWTTALLD
jgi:glycosyltransferase involved in cell wall biosynthesis